MLSVRICVLRHEDSSNICPDMYFYAYNWGGLVLNFFEAGDHVGGKL